MRTTRFIVAQEFLARMGSGTELAEIAELFSDNLEWGIAGDIAALPAAPAKAAHPTTHPEFVPMVFSSTILV
jgi:hypothetical protein